MMTSRKWIALRLCLLLISIPCFGAEHQGGQTTSTEVFVIDPCEDMWRHACHELKGKENSPERDVALTADRALALLSQKLKEQGKLSDLEKTFKSPFFELSWTKIFQNLDNSFQKDPEKTFEVIASYFSKDDVLPSTYDWPGLIKQYGLESLLDETAEDKQIRSSSKRREVMQKRFLQGLFKKMPVSASKDLVNYLMIHDLIFRSLPRSFDEGTKLDPKLLEKFEGLVPAKEKADADLFLQTIKTYTTQLSPSHRALADEKLMPNIPLAWPPDSVRLAKAERVNPWSILGTAGYDQYFIQGKKITMVRVPNARYRYFRVMAHEYGHAVDFESKSKEVNAFHKKLEQCLTSAMLGAQVTEGQMRELKADWYSTEVFASYLKSGKLTPAQKREAIIEASVLSCTEDKIGAEVSNIFTGTHPATQARTNQVYMAHPYIREMLGCAPNPRVRYCPSL